MASQALTLQDADFSSTPNRARGLKLSVTSVARDVYAIVSRLPLWCAVFPIAGLGLIGALGSGQLLPWFVGKYAWTGKDFQEIVGPSLLAASVVLAVYFWWVERHVCRAWVICLPTVLLCRELHFPGTGTGVYIGLIALAVSAIRHRERLMPVWNCSALCGWWFGAVSWYVLAVSVDSGVWKFLPHSLLWGVNLEETMESCGHLFVLLGLLSSVLMVIGNRRATESASFSSFAD